MYSVVLMMALTTGGDSPAFCGCRGCGCWGCGCWSCGCSCWGGCRGCWGCHGCYSCGCCSCYGCHGCYSCGCCSCYGCHGCYSCGCCCGGYVAPAHHAVPVAPAPAPAPAPEKKGAAAAPARILVNLPADAKLTIDDATTRSTGASRVFATPNLEPGKEFQYTLKAEVVRDGQTLTSTKQVTVRAGQETRVSIDVEQPTSVASK